MTDSAEDDLTTTREVIAIKRRALGANSWSPRLPLRRSNVSWNMERSPSIAWNYLGWWDRETGHSRVPDPPAMVTG